MCLFRINYIWKGVKFKIYEITNSVTENLLTSESAINDQKSKFENEYHYIEFQKKSKD